MSLPITMRLPEVSKKTGLARSTIYRLQSIGDFPHSVKVTDRRVVCLEEEVEEWLIRRIKRRKVIL